MWVALLLLAGCQSNWFSTQDLTSPSARTVSFSGNAVLCAGGGTATGGGYSALSCTAPVEVTTGRAGGSGYVWVPGSAELVNR